MYVSTSDRIKDKMRDLQRMHTGRGYYGRDYCHKHCARNQEPHLAFRKIAVICDAIIDHEHNGFGRMGNAQSEQKSRDLRDLLIAVIRDLGCNCRSSPDEVARRFIHLISDAATEVRAEQARGIEREIQDYDPVADMHDTGALANSDLIRAWRDGLRDRLNIPRLGRDEDILTLRLEEALGIRKD
ncbi:MAG: hypothetical protein WCT31_01435 [Candidatus Micrarchaeia archaeon]